MQENENLEIWSKTPLADLSQLLLLLLINHSSSSALIAEAPAVPEDHCYRLALYHCYSHKGKYFFISAIDLLCLYFCKISCQILQCFGIRSSNSSGGSLFCFGTLSLLPTIQSIEVLYESQKNCDSILNSVDITFF